jgi:peptidoglycan hydrolase CwlO-like protein
MEWKDALRAAIQEWVLPEFDKLRLENAEIRSTLQLTNRRLDDLQLQLVDLSRRLDETNKRIDETNKRIDKIHADLIGRIDETHKRIDRLYEVIVRRDEHIGLERWVRELDRKVLALEGRLPA